MKSFISFTKKEFIEMSRTYKLLIIGCVFLFLGMLNPLTAKLMPKLLSSLSAEGITINIPEPSALDSWAQFFKNVPQMGLIVIVIIFSGIMANEYSKGTLIILLTKGLKRETVIISKFITSISMWTLGYWLCAAISYVYTIYFWNDKVENLLFSMICLWVFGILLLSVVLLGGVLFKTNYGSMIFTGGFYVILFILGIPTKIKKYNPIMLSSSNMALINLENKVSDFTIPLISSVALTIIMVFISIRIFNKKKL